MSGSKRGRSLADVMSSIEDDGSTSSSVNLDEKSSEAVAELSGRNKGRNLPDVVPVNILVAPEDRKRLRQLSLDTSLSLQKLGHEAWNLLLQKRGLSPLKPVSANVPSGRGRARQD